MPIGMGVASPKFSKNDRKLNKTKYCTTPIYREKYKENPIKRGTDLIRCKWQVKMSYKDVKKMHQVKIEGRIQCHGRKR